MNYELRSCLPPLVVLLGKKKIWILSPKMDGRRLGKNPDIHDRYRTNDFASGHAHASARYDTLSSMTTSGFLS